MNKLKKPLYCGAGVLVAPGMLLCKIRAHSELLSLCTRFVSGALAPFSEYGATWFSLGVRSL